MMLQTLIQDFKKILTDKSYQMKIYGNSVVILTMEDAYFLLNRIDACEPRLLRREEVMNLNHGDDVYIEVHMASASDVHAATVSWTNKKLKQAEFIGEESIRRMRDYNWNIPYSWRVWTYRPSAEQMKSTPWNGQ